MTFTAYMTVKVLDTGPRQANSERIYREAGYRSIGNFNANPIPSFWGEREL